MPITHMIFIRIVFFLSLVFSLITGCGLAKPSIRPQQQETNVQIPEYPTAGQKILTLAGERSDRTYHGCCRAFGNFDNYSDDW